MDEIRLRHILDTTNQAIVFTQERIRADFPQEAIAGGAATLNAFLLLKD